jgi:hypothetical protein
METRNTRSRTRLQTRSGRNQELINPLEEPENDNSTGGLQDNPTGVPSSMHTSDEPRNPLLTPRGIPLGNGRLTRENRAPASAIATPGQQVHTQPQAGSEERGSSNRNSSSSQEPSQQGTSIAEGTTLPSSQPTSNQDRAALRTPNPGSSSSNPNRGSGRIEISSFIETEQQRLREARAADRERERQHAERLEQERREQEQRDKEADDAAHRARQERILKEIEEEEQNGNRPLPLQHFAQGDPSRWLPHERLNSKIHLAILDYVQRLKEVGDKLVQVMEVDRITIGDDLNSYPFNHESIPGQASHSVQRRTLLAISSQAGNIFAGSTTEEIAMVIRQLINQRDLFQNDCCPQPRLALEADKILQEALLLAYTALPTEYDKSKLLLTREIGESLTHTQRQLFEPPLERREPNKALVGNSGHMPNFLRTMADIPKETTFVPGKPSFNKVLDFVRDCENNELPLRIAQWPNQLVEAISTQYRQHFRTSHTGHIINSDGSDRDWITFNPHELRVCFEEMKPDGDVRFNQKYSYENFLTYLSTKPLEVDWAVRCHASQHPINQEVLVINQRFQKTLKYMKSLKKDLSFPQHHELRKMLLKQMRHRNLGRDARAIVMGDLNATFSSNTYLFEDVLKVIADYVVGKIAELNDLAVFNEISDADSSNWGRSHPKKRDNRDSDGGPNPKKGKPNPSNRHKASETSNPKASANKPTCKRCGYFLSKKDGKGLCNRKPACHEDPRKNASGTPWSESTVGKQWAELGFKCLPKDATITLQNAKDRKSKLVCLAKINDLMLTHDLIDFYGINVPQNKDSPTLHGRLLLDSGALGSSVVSTSFYKNLCNNNIDFTMNDSVEYELATALDESVLINKQISFNITMKSERVDHSHTSVKIKVTAIIADINVDLILDREIIKENNLLLHFPSHFASSNLLRALNSLPNLSAAEDNPSAHSITDNVESDSNQHTASDLNKFFNDDPQLEIAWVNKFRVATTKPRRAWMRQQKYLAREKRKARREMLRAWQGLVDLAQRDDSDESEKQRKPAFTNKYTAYLAQLASNASRKPAFQREAGSLVDIPDNKLEALPAELLSDILDEAEYTKVTIEGPALLRQKLEALIREFKDIFRATVQGKPAQLFPFELQVDGELWYTRANQLHPRSMDRERALELDRIIQVLLEHGIIEPCDDSHYSHAFLVPKPNGKWRLVLDFKNLNKATTNSYRWPLPDIKEMLNRIGDSKPSFFAVFDLTSGYYQAPISEESRKYTAFTTRNGVYRWKRLPMGLTGAGSYFQHSLATQVLQGLLHHGTELYLDDCLVHASSMNEYLERLRTVFLRFRNSGITLNPSKCKLGLSQVEYVGHTIDSDGLHFTRSKLDSVLNFPRPETKRQLKSFLGLANYFRDHIKNHSLRVEHLQQLVSRYDKRHASHKLKWSPEALAAFEDIRTAIGDCPKLWFLDDHSPIFLQTDASDYGIGAYLYQKVPQEIGTVIEHPVNFISKSIASKHLSWDTPMKEGYAIFYALNKWDYLLRDRQFTIETDHQNLTRLRADHHDANKMVKRWFLAFQEYDIIKWDYRKGVDNEVPDTLSRLCPKEPDEHPAVHLFHLTGIEVPADKWDIIKKFHNSGDLFEGAGHGGINRTVKAMRARGHDWPHMTKHVRRFIKLCPCCQKMDQMKSVIHSYPFTTSTYGLWDTVSVDYIESLRPDELGNNMIIVIVDNFSRFVHLTAAKSTRAEGAADALLQFAGQYATPSRFYTDSGASFKNKIVQGLTEILGADHSFTAAYSKEQNAIVERQNKEVLRHLRNIIFNKKVIRRWSRYLPIVQRMMNTSINTSTGVAPAEVVFPNGRKLDHSLVSNENPIFISDYIRDMQNAQAAIIAVCEQNLRTKDKAHMGKDNGKRTVYEQGTYVLAEHRHNSLRSGPPSKFLPYLRGPMLVKSHDAKGMYTLQDIVTQRLVRYHVSRLRTYLYDERTLTPLEAAVADFPDEFIPEQCLGVRGDPRGPKANLRFHMRWAGYGPEYDSVEPWAHVKDTDMVLTYLANHPNKRYRRLVPKSFVPPANREVEEAMEIDEDI